MVIIRKKKKFVKIIAHRRGMSVVDGWHERIENERSDLEFLREAQHAGGMGVNAMVMAMTHFPSRIVGLLYGTSTPLFYQL